MGRPKKKIGPNASNSTALARIPATSLTKRKRPSHQKIDINKALQLRLKGLTYLDIANTFGTSKQAIAQALKPFIGTNDIDPQAWRQNKASILEHHQARLITSLTDAEIKSMAPRDRVLAFGVIFDKTRLEKGESTSNISLFSRAVIQACQDDQDPHN